MDGTDTLRHRVTLAGTDTSFEVEAGERLLAAARRAGTWLPFECGWGGCGTCKVTVLDGETELLFDAPSVDPRDERRRRVLVCQSTARGDLTIRTGQTSSEPWPERPLRDHRGRLVEHEDLGPDLARLRFRLEAEAVYRPGQHAILDLGDGLRRCYSLAGVPGTDEVSFIAKRYPGRPGSNRLFDVAVGQEVALELPYGDMWVREGEAPVVLVAGGTGISAVLAMAEDLARRRTSRAVHVFYGAGTRGELVCWEELEAAAADLPDGHLHGALLEPSAGWSGVVGFVTAALGARLPGLADAVFHVAGPPPMTDATVGLLRDHGVQLDRVHFDSFG
ncbi:2Fe-2S iron-sulfur cluster binding domain-containing protein [Phycicoccus sp. HDW14]|uniref:2Fe-2S iron-sulfur cluster binding domain-containing protein n=1 Tax=Phycicoccus sp. HDW14 TaxID=2714941 RepID=UPI00140B97DE|nr:2Fe-2S iron-sulfur cluster binding domain-containing protein [Phycicoccus sp. HDW14]QIM22833.1 2Fe-2S iron-sulfur cluster binding domain-containing protein [Phycicoccus sp. HDW14]